MDRLGDVLQRPFADVFEDEVGLAGELLLHRIGNADTSGLRQRLEPRRDVDAISEQVTALDDDVTDVDADAEHDAALRRNVPLIGGDRLLYGDGTGHSIDG